MSITKIEVTNSDGTVEVFTGDIEVPTFELPLDTAIKIVAETP